MQRSRKGLVRRSTENRPTNERKYAFFVAFFFSFQETDMSDPVIDKILRHPKYQELRSKRNSFGWLLAVLMLVVYYGYIALIAFNKPFLAQPLGSGVTTLGIPLGMGVIVFTIVITGIYVSRANSEYDALTQEILKDATK
jgi:uncharacterized membrane protein (DUF485 family)